MAEHYTKTQIDSQATVLGNRIKTRTTGTAIVAAIAGESDVNLITDAERNAIGTIEPSKHKGSYATLTALNTAHPTGVSGDNATILVTGGDDTVAIWDDDAGAFIDTGGAATAETAATIKSKYESNANTNAFTDTEKTKLAGITDAADITSFTAALDAALA